MSVRRLKVEVPLLNPKSSQKEIGQASLLLPRLMFASLACYDMFENLVQSNACETFWDNVEKCKDDRLKEHPMKTKLWKKLTIPLMVHGDAAEFQSRDSLMIWSWGSLLCSKKLPDGTPTHSLLP